MFSPRQVRRPRQTQGGARQGIILLTVLSDYYRSRRSSSNSRRSKAGLRVACYCEWFRSQVAVAEQPAVGRCFCCLCGPQVGVGGSSRQRQSFNFLGVSLLCFGDEIRCCFAVSDVSKRVSGCLFVGLEAVWLQQHQVVFRRRFVASSSFTAMVFEAGGSRVLAAWKVEVLSLFELISSLLLVCYRISEATLGNFSAPFRGFFVLHCHGVWGWRIPCFGGLEGGSFELISSLVCYRISEATLGSFSAPFRGFFVLHCHGVWGWRIPCFGGLEGGSFELISSLVCYIELISSLVCIELVSSLVCYRISEATLGSFSAPFRGFFVFHCHGVWGWRIPCFGGLEGGSFELIEHFRSHVRPFFGAVSWLRRPSLPWCLRLADPVFWRPGRWKFWAYWAYF